MQQSLLLLLLFAIIGLCSANELPFLTQLELDKIFDDQDNDKKLENTEEIMLKQLNKPLKSKIYETEENENNLDNLNEYNNDYLTYYRKQNGRNKHRSPKGLSKKDTESDDSKNIKLIEDSLKNYEEIVTISPLLILNIHLSYLTNHMENMKPKLYHYSMPEPKNFMTNTKDELNKIPQDDINSFNNEQQDDEGFGTESKSTKNKKVVKKRIFSLWSRLQGLQRGHELHHRRHLYAFYGLPDDGGGGGDSTLTAETRATFLRPPGSPLRWG